MTIPRPNTMPERVPLDHSRPISIQVVVNKYDENMYFKQFLKCNTNVRLAQSPALAQKPGPDPRPKPLPPNKSSERLLPAA